MSKRLAAATGAVLFSGTLVIGGATAALATPCDAYSRVCPSTPPTTIGGGGNGPATAPSPSATPVQVTGASTAPGALPFTGAQLVLYVTIGGVAVAAGTGLVLAGRRRTRTAD